MITALKSKNPDQKKVAADSLLGVFSKFHLSVLLTVRMKQLGSDRLDFHEIPYMSIFKKSVNKIRVSLKSTKQSVFYMKPYLHLRKFAQFFLEWEMF